MQEYERTAYETRGTQITRLNEQVAQLLENNRQLGAGQDRLRAELAAEKERAEHWKTSWQAADKTVRTRNREIMELEDAAAIRASNAAPLESLPGELARHCLSEGGTPAPNAAPPHVEPSAAESERRRRLGTGMWED